MSLQQIQRDFWRAVRFDPTPPDALAHFEGDERMSAAERIAVYRSMYWYRQVDALGETFPRLRDRLGGERFTKLACRYLRHHPSTRPTLEHIGQALPAFVAGELPEWAGLCRLEWARTSALLSADPSRIATPADVDPSTFAQTRLVFVPSLRVIETDARAIAAYDEEQREDDEPVTVTVWRRGFAVRHHVMNAEEAASLELAMGGACVATVLARYDEDDQGVARAFEMILGWLNRHWIETLHHRDSA